PARLGAGRSSGLISISGSTTAAIPRRANAAASSAASAFGRVTRARSDGRLGIAVMGLHRLRSLGTQAAAAPRPRRIGGNDASHPRTRRLYRRPFRRPRAGRGRRDRPARLYRHDRDDDRRLARRGAADPETGAVAAAGRRHPSTVLVPAILAEGEALGATGKAMIAAYVAGYEAWAEVANRDPGHHHKKGWHPTGIFGAIAAAAACASLRGLDAEKATMAVALAASQSSGLMANFGTMTKPFHAGRAAHSGLMSARMAAGGFTAAADALEHPQGFLSAVSPEGLCDRESPARLGQEWHIVRNRLSIKKYPACYGLHRTLDGMLDLLDKRPLQPEEIARITASVSKTRALILRNHRPQTG